MMKDFREILNQYEPKPLGQRRRYAVMLPLVWNSRANSWEVLYQVRSEAVSQPGEVSFPGGALEGNETYEEAAVRETMEELNLSANQIEILGEIDYMVNNRGSIHCFVGKLAIENWQDIKPNEEVARLFTISLEVLMQEPPHYYRLKTAVKPSTDFPFERIRNGVDYKFTHYDRKIPFYELVDENIWGLTAQFTHRFTEILDGNE